MKLINANVKIEVSEDFSKIDAENLRDENNRTMFYNIHKTGLRRSVALLAENFTVDTTFAAVREFLIGCGVRIRTFCGMD